METRMLVSASQKTQHNKNIEYMQFIHLKKCVHSVIHIILFVIKNIYHLAVLMLTLLIHKTAQKQYSVEENMKFIRSSIIPI